MLNIWIKGMILPYVENQRGILRILKSCINMHDNINLEFEPNYQTSYSIVDKLNLVMDK